MAAKIKCRVCKARAGRRDTVIMVAIGSEFGTDYEGTILDVLAAAEALAEKQGAYSVLVTPQVFNLDEWAGVDAAVTRAQGQREARLSGGAA